MNTLMTHRFTPFDLTNLDFVTIYRYHNGKPPLRIPYGWKYNGKTVLIIDFVNKLIEHELKRIMNEVRNADY